MRELHATSHLARYFKAFVDFKRSTGIDFRSSISHLERLDRFLVECRATTPESVDRLLLNGFVRSLKSLSPRTRTNAVSIAWQALEYAQKHGAAIPPLPERPRFRRHHVVEPYAYSVEEINRILLALLDLEYRPRARDVPSTVATVTALLVTTGLRISEALALDVEDFDLDGGILTVRAGKFDKPRLVPILDSTREALERHLERRRQPAPSVAGSPLFLSSRGARLRPPSVSIPFKRVVRSLGIVTPGGATPRLHDLRHTFAVRRVTQWYLEGEDVNAHLAALSTYLGHTSPAHTAHYLQANESILKEAGARFEAYAAPAEGATR